MGRGASRGLLGAAVALLASFAAACIFLALLMESIPFEVFLPISSIALLAACTAAFITLSSTMLGFVLRWLKREG